jgi:hypothetical protein
MALTTSTFRLRPSGYTLALDLVSKRADLNKTVPLSLDTGPGWARPT